MVSIGFGVSAKASTAFEPQGQPVSYFSPPRYESSSLEQGITLLILVNIQRCLENYRNDYHKMPEGTLRDILVILEGKNLNDQNPLKAPFLSPVKAPTLILDKEGNLLDGWGNPFRLERNQLKGSIILISAGSNRIFNQSQQSYPGQSDDIYVVIDPEPKR